MLADYCLKVNKFFVSGCYSGLSRVAPGTAGSLAFLIIWVLLLREQPLLVNLVLFIAITSIGVNCIEIVLKFHKNLNTDAKGKIDPQWIVIDEWAGLYAALLFVNPNSIWQIAAAFLLFRILDATKLPPVNYAERLKGSLGIMADDLVAGLISGFLFYAIGFYL